MLRRLNLQSIGAYVRDGSDKRVDYTSFEERANRAYSRLQNDIAAMCGGESNGKIMERINAYCNVVEEIYFSLGMKAGATLQVKLLDNYESDI